MLAIIDGDVLLYISIWGAETKEEARENFDSLFEAVLEGLFTTDYVMALGGPDNFRFSIYSEYKANRKKSKSTRPKWFLDLKSEIVNDYEGCISTDNCEADDMVRIWANECKQNYVIVTIDKDLDCIEGLHYNPRKKEIHTVGAGYADYFYWKQLLMGDSVDNITGIPNIGPKKSEKMLEDTTGAMERKEVVCKAYRDFYGEEGHSYLLANGKLLHIWRYLGDYFKFPKEKYDIYVNK
jgi:DNA polymerase-1